MGFRNPVTAFDLTPGAEVITAPGSVADVASGQQSDPSIPGLVSKEVLIRPAIFAGAVGGAILTATPTWQYILRWMTVNAQTWPAGTPLHVFHRTSDPTGIFLAHYGLGFNFDFKEFPLLLSEGLYADPIAGFGAGNISVNVNVTILKF